MCVEQRGDAAAPPAAGSSQTFNSELDYSALTVRSSVEERVFLNGTNDAAAKKVGLLHAFNLCVIHLAISTRHLLRVGFM